MNDDPVVRNDSYNLTEDTPLTVSAPGVLANDSDVDGDTLSATVGIGPAHGTLSLAADGSFVYTPDLDYNGPDSFTYTAQDGFGGIDSATVTLAIGAANDAPAAADDAASTPEDSAVTIAVIGNDSDADENPLTVTATGPAGHGTVTFTGAAVTYTPNANWFGTDSFEYTVSDSLLTDTATVTITVTPVNDAPVADAGPDVVVNEGQLITRMATCSDVDPGDTHSFQWIVVDTDGNTQGTSGTQEVTFRPSDDDGQPYIATFVVTDRGGASCSDSCVIQVLNVAPVVSAGPDATVGTGVLFSSSGLFTDPGADRWTATVDYGAGAGVQPLSLNPDGSFSLSHVYTTSGSYTVTVNVADDDGGQGSDAAVVIVSGGGSNAAIDVEKYVMVVDSEGGTEGLSPGYWKQKQHFDEWFGFKQSDRYETVFGVDAPGCPTLLDALQANGGGVNALLRQSSAALLNAAHPNIDYAYTKAEIISMVRGAFASGNYESVKNQFEVENEKGADLSDAAGGGSDSWTPGDGFGLDADEAPGLKAAVGETVQFTYVVTNPGEVALGNVLVVDDHGTPGVPADDFVPNAVLTNGKISATETATACWTPAKPGSIPGPPPSPPASMSTSPRRVPSLPEAGSRSQMRTRRIGSVWPQARPLSATSPGRILTKSVSRIRVSRASRESLSTSTCRMAMVVTGRATTVSETASIRSRLASRRLTTGRGPRLATPQTRATATIISPEIIEMTGTRVVLTSTSWLTGTAKPQKTRPVTRSRFSHAHPGLGRLFAMLRRATRTRALK